MSELNNRYRACTVNGELGVFHRWEEKEIVYMSFKTMLREDRKLPIIERFQKDKVIDTYAEIAGTDKRVLAIVEFADGSIKEVNPTDLIFTDSDIYLFTRDEAVSACIKKGD